jgi:hypothetical protein
MKCTVQHVLGKRTLFQDVNVAVGPWESKGSIPKQQIVDGNHFKHKDTPWWAIVSADTHD